FTTIKYALGRSSRETWSCRRPRSVTQPKLETNWPRTGKASIGSSMLSKIKLTHSQRRRENCCLEHDIYPT
ncbi:hypothetical protein BHM03_00004741, partial [Ensete ventricosum]